MLQSYTVLTKVDAFLLTKHTDNRFIGEFLTGIPYSITDKGIVIVTPDGDITIEFDQYYLMFEPGSRQLLTIEKDRFEKNATLIEDDVDTTNLDSWEGSNETVQ